MKAQKLIFATLIGLTSFFYLPQMQANTEALENLSTMVSMAASGYTAYKSLTQQGLSKYAYAGASCLLTTALPYGMARMFPPRDSIKKSFHGSHVFLDTLTLNLCMVGSVFVLYGMGIL